MLLESRVSDATFSARRTSNEVGYSSKYVARHGQLRFHCSELSASHEVSRGRQALKPAVPGKRYHWDSLAKA